MVTIKELKELLTGVMTDADFSNINIDRNSRLVSDLGMNSIHMILMGFTIQEKYDIDLEEFTIGASSTVGEVIDFINKKIK